MSDSIIMIPGVNPIMHATGRVLEVNIAKFDRYDLVNTPGESKAAFTIWFAGCSMHCDGCYNSRLWDPAVGQRYEVNTVLFTICSECEKQEMDTVVLLGGEPMEQQYDDLKMLLYKLHSYGYKIWLYTGWEFDQVPLELKNYLYTIKCGRFDQSLLQTGKFPASSNQKVYRKIDDVWSEISLQEV